MAGLPTGGNYKPGADPRLVSILEQAANGLDLDVELISGYRPGDSRQHGKKNAIDVQLIDRNTGRRLDNYQNAADFRAYEKFAQIARSVQQEQHPELSNRFRWGGYFSGPAGKYGALDTMHFDLAGGKLGMAGGSWEKGLTAQQRKLYPGVVSKGLNDAPLPPMNIPRVATAIDAIENLAPRPAGPPPAGVRSAYAESNTPPLPRARPMTLSELFAPGGPRVDVGLQKALDQNASIKAGQNAQLSDRLSQADMARANTIGAAPRASELADFFGGQQSAPARSNTIGAAPQASELGAMFSSGSSRANSIGNAPNSRDLASMFSSQSPTKLANTSKPREMLNPTAPTAGLGAGILDDKKSTKNVPSKITKTIQVANPAYSAALAAQKNVDNGAFDEKKSAKNGAPRKPAASLPPKFITKTVTQPNPAYRPLAPVAQPRTIASQFAPVEVPVRGGAVQGGASPKFGDVIGRGPGSSIVTQGRNGPLNSATQNSLAWKNATGQNGFRGGGNRDGVAQSLSS